MADYPLIDIDLSGKKKKKKPKSKPKISLKKPSLKGGKAPKKPGRKVSLSWEQVVTVVMVLIMIAPLVWLAWQYSALKQEERQERALLAQRKKEYQRLKPIEAKLQLLEKKKKALVTKVNTIKNLSADRREVPDVFNEWERIMPDTLWVVSFNFTPGKRIAIKGYALTEANIARFIDALRRSPHYGGYNLGYVKSMSMSNIKMKEFTLSLRSTPPKLVKVDGKVKR